MSLRAALAATTVLAALAMAPAPAGAAGWDPTPLVLSPISDSSPQLGPLVETTDDGAVWVMWAEDRDQDNQFDVVVRRVGVDGVPGERRVVTSTDPSYFGSIALAPLPGGDVRVAYTSEGAAKLEERRLTPTSTGDPVVLYDKAITDNGNVSPVSVKVLAAPGGASWVTFVRSNSGTPLVSARRIADDDSVGSLVTLSQSGYEPDAAVDPSGRLVFVMASGAQARTILVRVDTNGDIAAEVEIRAAYGSFAAANTPAIGIDGAGIATVGWRLDVGGGARYLEIRRADTSTTPMTPLGAGPTPVNDDLPQDFVQYGPLFGVDPGGAVLAGWYETDSNVTSDDAIVRVLGAGALADSGVIGPRLQLDGPSPEGAGVSDIVPGPAGIATALLRSSEPPCHAVRIDLASGEVLGTEAYGPSTCYGVGPADGANGVAATWLESLTYRVLLSRYVTAAPSCSDGTPVTVAAGERVTLALPCTGWRPQREVTGAPGHGTLGALDQAQGTVTYTAGPDAASDTVRYRATNGAGASPERSLAITVTKAEVQNPPPPDTSDHTPPALTGLSLKPGRVTLPRLRPPTLSFSLSEAARVDVGVHRLVKGRRRHGRCVTRPLPRRGARCTKATRALVNVIARLPAGAAGLKIGLRWRTGHLSAGRYRVTVKATDAAGNASAVYSVSLRITRH